MLTMFILCYAICKLSLPERHADCEGWEIVLVNRRRNIQLEIYYSYSLPQFSLNVLHLSIFI